MTTAWLIALVGIGAFCIGLGVAAAVFCAGSQSEEGRRA